MALDAHPTSYPSLLCHKAKDWQQLCIGKEPGGTWLDELQVVEILLQGRASKVLES
jgi:hypothetical protein